jgi:hypothetical protein
MIAGEPNTSTWMAFAAIGAAAVIGLGVGAAVVFIWRPGTELVKPNAPIAQVSAPSAPVTPHVRTPISPALFEPYQASILSEQPSPAGLSKPVVL